MVKIKKFVSVLCFALCFGFTFAQVKLDPVYTSERFQPSDKFHAGCENQIDVVFHLDDSKINGVNAIMEYDGKNIDIVKILPQGEKENNLTYVVEDNKVVFSKLKADGEGLDSVKFSLFFKVDVELKNTEFVFSKGSYLVDSQGKMVDIEGTYDFEFVDVPECNPDIVEPNVELLFPAENGNIALDSYFQFKITDQGKGVNFDSITVSVAGKNYNIDDMQYEWKDDVLTVYPDFWLPVNSSILVKVYVADNQVYGNANTKTMLYEFKTSEDFSLLSNIDPVSLRNLLRASVISSGGKQECEALNSSYFNLGLTDQEKEYLLSINEKLGCPEFVVKSGVTDNVDIEVSDDIDENMPKYSVFAILGWILFVGLVLFMLFFKLGKRSKKINN